MMFSFFSFSGFLGITLTLSTANNQTIQDIPLPAGYKRILVAPSSFGAYLRSLPLKKENTVYLYNGNKKSNQSAHYAVLDVSTGNKDLQQCADAVMRLRAEYLKKQNQAICFSDNAGKSYCWSSYQQQGWQRYLDIVFGMCGTLSLEKQLKKAHWNSLQPGDVIIKGGSPGHAVLVVDVARHQNTGKLIFMLAQSYMPAQDIHILLNRNESDLSQWYSIPSNYLYTPEWTFETNQLRAWP